MEVENSQDRKIERNFLLPKDFHEKALALGAKLLEESAFQDTYYDTPDFKLTLGNYWLRSRGDVFELKFPTGGADSEYASQYQETKDGEAIVKQLCLLLNLKKEDVPNIKQLATQDLEKFATIETLRKVYQLEECTISVDIADFGLDLGIISVLQKKEESIVQATNRINELAKKLGCTSFADLDMNTLVKDSLPQLSLDDPILGEAASGGDAKLEKIDEESESGDVKEKGEDLTHTEKIPEEEETTV